MNNYDIIIKIENLSIFFSCIEQQVRDVNSELVRIENELKILQELIGDKSGKDDH
jgi:hypothetical protein